MRGRTVVTPEFGDLAPPRIVHVFPGQGDFATSPLVRALRTHSVLREKVRDVFGEAEEAGAAFGIEPLAKSLLGDRPPTGRELAAGPAGTLQLALFCSSVAVHRALCAAGFGPDRVLGVSFGEIAALTSVGVFTLAEGARIACLLARQLVRCEGGMTLLGVGEGTARALLRAVPGAELVVACVNSPEETLVSGPLAGLRALEELAGRRGLVVARLRLPFSSHHPALTGPADAFAAAIGPLPARPARLPALSAVRGGPYGPGDDVHRGLADCLIRPVRMAPVLRQAAAGARTVFIEAGTGRALTRSVRQSLAPAAATAHAPLAEPGFPWPPSGTSGRPSPTVLWSHHDDHLRPGAR
ncbi:acyltransferase domain-containing protein [Streptomyces sp. NPDC001750]|uniref:acyltransferase domain-containing protein n=1 Tax=unclassified Streptomyces TaxID=2593676 RepID=UPI0036A4BD31